MFLNPDIFKVIPQWIIERWIIVAYLVIFDVHEKLADVLNVRPSEEFFGMVAEYVTAYLRDGTMPPDRIVTPILNLADSLASGDHMELRAGDYIALQNFMRER